MTAAALSLWLAFSPGPDFYGVKTWPQSFDAIIAYHADANLIPRFLARAIIREESDFDPLAQSHEWAYIKRLKRWVKTDKVLARGMAQVSANPEHEADHVRKAGMRLKDYDWRDPGDSLRVGMAYLGALLRYFRYEQRPSAAAYNAGRNRAEAWWINGRALPRETAQYTKRVLGGRR